MTSLALLIAALLLILSIVTSKLSGRLGIPGLLLFLIIGMIAGSEGPGGIEFANYTITQFVGIIALVFILYTGGLETHWKSTRPILRRGIVLATFGVLVTTGIAGYVASLLFHIPLMHGLLMGAVVASTDASAVFSVLKERALDLKGSIKPLLEFESGSNDPMAVFLTIGLIELIEHPGHPWYSIVPEFIQEMSIGAIFGLLLGRFAVLLFNKSNLMFDGLYSVLSLGLALLIYSLTAVAGGSGFLAVYLAAIVIGNSEFIHKKSVVHFHDGISWLMSIGMFLILGLLVFPSQLLAVAEPALILALILMFVARPLSVYLSTLFSKMPFAEKTMVAWVGLRGAVPITLATFPLLAGVEHSQTIFNAAFFIVLSSILVQGTSLPLVARWLNVGSKAISERPMPLDYTPTGRNKNDLQEITIPRGSRMHGLRIVDAHLPEEALIVLILRAGEYVIPRGSTELREGDILQVLGSKASVEQVKTLLQPAG
ncbi:potassium/proton antiporter [Deinococcus cellulosilyticus]|uniref:K+/H+ antiporter n=1 Tax=Deinococcus cellulosilyticus (strain DSM 18568 / NBRC 106333 / KACC 11606 / 5516J-15) TaxID=1223518 RepID=A0A511MWS6_DEIC1|nr:potassium/proton antiporter [Deinococcus cellulosilyticus]GEM44841.1 K+/H+ antiporter [Deinococcus cellulosilyticus NBRC 106333 = KACC 11606]